MKFPLYIGFEPRHAVGYTVTSFSAMHYASLPLQITPLILATLPIERKGLTEFSFSRFLVPWLQGYKGWALFCDSDIIFQDDPCKLWDFADPTKAVCVAEGIPDFEQAAIMLFNCAHPDNLNLTPDKIDKSTNLHTIGWTKEIGYFPSDYNHCVGYNELNDDAKVIHYTMGNPCWKETADCEHQDKWVREYKNAVGTVNWVDLMGQSIHAFQAPDGSLQPKYKALRDGS